YDAGGASARRKTPRESSMICPPSRQAYRSRGCTPCAREVSVVNVDGSDSSNSFMDTILAQLTQVCAVLIHPWSHVLLALVNSFRMKPSAYGCPALRPALVAALERRGPAIGRTTSDPTDEIVKCSWVLLLSRGWGGSRSGRRQPAGMVANRRRGVRRRARSSRSDRARTCEAACRCSRSPLLDGRALSEDRKSTRLNSSHMNISYAVFCL